MNLFNSCRDIFEDAGPKSRSWACSSLWAARSEEALREPSFFAVSPDSMVIDSCKWEAPKKIQRPVATGNLFELSIAEASTTAVVTTTRAIEGMFGRDCGRYYFSIEEPIVLQASNTSSTAAAHIATVWPGQSEHMPYTVLDLSREYQSVSRPFSPAEAKNYREFIDDFFD